MYDEYLYGLIIQVMKMSENSWEYEDFEFSNRVTNLMWTICGDYKEEMDLSEKTNLSKNSALYFGVTAGGRRKYINWILVDRYVNWRSRQGFSQKDLQGMLHPAINAMAVHRLTAERPGIADIQKIACGEMVAVLEQAVSAKFMDQVDFAVFRYLAGLIPESEKSVELLAAKLMEAAHAADTAELVERIDALYIRQFKPKSAEPFSLDKIDKYATGQLAKTEIFIEKAVESMLANEKFRIGEAESDEIGEIAKAEIIYIDGEQLKKMQLNVALFCGESYLKDHEVMRIEKRLCKGPHQDCRLHFTEGVIRGKSTSEAKIKFAGRDREKNQSAFKANLLIYEHAIKRLRDKLVQTLQGERAKYYVPGDCGIIDAHRLWRVDKVPCSRLFKRTESNDKGGFVVDLLIDSSFSQKGRESRVAIQTYIIARALVEAGIPCRVNGYNCFLTFTVLKRYRDFDDPVRVTENIFEYYCESSNRDGLAIKGVCDGLYARSEENKILIMLSDGKPNDAQFVKRDNMKKFRGEVAYSGGAAIGDTAKEVRIARQRGILVLGIFTGDERDLKAEKLIYGMDFIYTREVRYFADIVAAYLKRIITR